MIENKDIVVISIQPWDIKIGSNCKNIALEFAKKNRVLYVNPPPDRISLYRERSTEKIKKRIRVKNGQEPKLMKIEENIWNLYPATVVESINRIPSQQLFELLNRYNAKKFASAIRKALEQLNFKKFILFNDSSMFLGLHLKKLLSPTIYVYYMRDYLIKIPYWRKHGLHIEPELIRKADVVVNNSTLYTEYGSRYNKHSYMVGQGCDTGLFDSKKRKIEVAADMKNIPKPVIGYVGYLSGLRLSIEIIEHMAKTMKEWSIVLVGPEDEIFRNSVLHGIKNIYFMGSRDLSLLPRYIKGFDLTMNPQLINDATIGNYPRKIDEYLSMGKPVLATATKAMQYFKDHVYLGMTKEDYVKLGKKALAEDNRHLQEKRRAFGTGHSWENNVNKIYKAILKVSGEKKIEI
jgi:glycosyltransferase involved in cell wall biosynthesis